MSKKRARGRHRNRIEIFRHILEAANGSDVKKIRIIHKANLSHDQLKGYLKVLVERGLLSYDLDTKTFKATEKGLRFLEAYNQLDLVMKV
ncbi:MAG: winged helix-turn-helix domain-containing protein [Thermoproteota archaeon]|jgi:predicted transcriptional regulator|nr:winged helix-turn-helix domain-containing protein [Thermoproteota archaeon]